MEQSSNKFIAFIAILALPLAAGAFALAWAPSNQFFDFSPKNDGYVEPRNISKLIEDSQASTVTVFCNLTKKNGSQGTGWAIDSKVLKVSSSKTTVMTNHHVIDECIGREGTVTVARLFKKEKPARILLYDAENDLAVLETDLKLPGLELSENYMWPGYWVMTLGSAAGYEGSVSFGNIINTLNEDVLITNNISEGNSGGPLIDNEGKVVGIVTWGSDNEREQFNGARSLDTFCLKIVKCEYEYEGKATWLDYEE
ncbi:MAG: trypsin-like peptidase domain-containing protein [Candidatus Nanopelagicaceae bacterium]|nr:trypsin-like peptidase domain-containing protein [Candidatus Nanopelagicaceae bacterium]